ncbi:SDR family oxidoreductase [Actinomycetospora termitidis]|uniref:SDR family oxidoreductase n=1 Tax=Actinomycetospora termitidis TaxID=3053470 RepID=A0ABT7MCZ4_9PSEU|nr:SDR family oxidoreductase [Actinomycetospora sp. Odt1-22]MDL5158336.1 SDR family oxidoreductase [Actinomycetospora sp. Odt1-22]
MSSVLITGASKGIGRAIATEFARRGHRVVATARNPATLADLDVADRLALDVTDPGSIAAVERAGEVDVLVSNAGVIFYAAVEATPPEELASLFEQNTVGALRVAQAVLPGMRARGSGRLLFMSSVAGRTVLPPGGAYAATKWALEALVEALAIEVAPFGLQATLLEPGAVSSGALDDVPWHRLPDDPYPQLGAGGSARRTFITPEQVATAVVDAAETPDPPLRLPIGEPAEKLLAARHAAPDDRPFVP